MPIPVRHHFVKFRYKSRGEGRVPALAWSWLPNVKRSDIYLDGGNCQRANGTAIVTDIIFKDNPHYGPRALVRELSTLLQADIIVIPQEPGDILGHSDGMVAWIPGRKAVFVNDFKSRLTDKIRKIMSAHGISSVLFPLMFDRAPTRHKQICAFGYYINFLVVKSTVFLPSFGLDEDHEAKEILQNNFKCDVIQVPCTRLSMQGGCIHCVTVDYSEENLCQQKAKHSVGS
jgi:agmatine/peptidylarginine deiminase